MAIMKEWHKKFRQNWYATPIGIVFFSILGLIPALLNYLEKHPELDSLSLWELLKHIILGN
jgi:hypothetical protein